jgi:lipid-binding SYLF domain-containing protein
MSASGTNITRRAACLILGLAAMAWSPAAHADETQESRRLADAVDVFKTTLGGEDASVPERLLESCHCVAVFPGVVKGAIGWGGRRGHGVMSCRDSAGHWSAPTFLTLTGGSFGFQIGVQKTDLVLFVMTEKSGLALLANDFTVGASGSVAAGPAGRSAEGATNIKLDSEMYSYARSKGLFAGISLEGARISNDTQAITRYYGRALEPRDIVMDHAVESVPSSARAFIDALPATGAK